MVDEENGKVEDPSVGGQESVKEPGVVVDAHQRAAGIILEAEGKAKSIVMSAEGEAAKIMDGANKELVDLNMKISNANTNLAEIKSAAEESARKHVEAGQALEDLKHRVAEIAAEIASF